MNKVKLVLRYFISPPFTLPSLFQSNGWITQSTALARGPAPMLQTSHPILATLILMAGENCFPSSTIAKIEELHLTGKEQNIL
jgi:hypothetical protein